MSSESPPTPVSRAARMDKILRHAFAPEKLVIQDDSARHAGHAGASAEGETHFTVEIVSETFTGRSRVERSRMVYEILSGEFATRLHAISLVLHTPGEARS